jgi:transcriptional regulator with XRE-family HTH domain
MLTGRTERATLRDMTGMQLKLRRVAARVKGRALAREMGVTASRVSAIEREAFVTDEAAARYLEALATLTNVPESEAA